MMDMISSSKMEKQFIAGQNWKSKNVLRKTTKVLHKTPVQCYYFVSNLLLTDKNLEKWTKRKIPQIQGKP